MKAISLTAAWGSAMAAGFKSIETRSWRCPDALLRGGGTVIAIHQSKGLKPGIRAWWEQQPQAAVLAQLGGWLNVPLGAVVAVGLLVDVRPTTVAYEQLRLTNSAAELLLGDYTAGRWAWVFGDVEPIRPVPAKGALGFWDWEANAEAKRLAAGLVQRYSDGAMQDMRGGRRLGMLTELERQAADDAAEALFRVEDVPAPSRGNAEY